MNLEEITMWAMIGVGAALPIYGLIDGWPLPYVVWLAVIGGTVVFYGITANSK